MYIKKVKIQNFKCYREFEIELNDGLYNGPKDSDQY